MRRFIVFFSVLFAFIQLAISEEQTFSISGRIIDIHTRDGIAYCAVCIEGDSTSWAVSDSIGRFRIERAQPGIQRLKVTCMGYKSILTAEYMISSKTPFIVIELEEDTRQLSEISIIPTPVQRTTESPVSLHVIGIQDIEKMPGANRDISRIVRSFPGVSFSPIGYRNDLIVRGGGPAENRFYMEGIEIPNINHFATQGASGGPISLINSDLVREINFHTGAFPSNRFGALSSILDFRLKDGDPESHSFKATLGASEVSMSGSGHIGKKTTYLFSARQSYLQFLFKLLGLPFLPNYIDGQLKIKTKFSKKNELTFMMLGGVDRMKLNTSEQGESNEYMLSYLPTISQDTYTLGAVYRHYSGRHTQSLYASHNFLHNRLVKYNNNDESSELNLRMHSKGMEQKTSLRYENKSNWKRWIWKAGAEGHFICHDTRNIQRIYGIEKEPWIHYNTKVGLWTWGLYSSVEYATEDERLKTSVGLQTEATSYGRMKNPLNQLSPRASLKYTLATNWSVAASAGIYYQIPTLTALAYKDDNGTLLNKMLKYQRVSSKNIGIDWRPTRMLTFTIEGFHKKYTDMPLCITENIPLACKGNDYGLFGNEPLRSTAIGRSYGMELLGKWQIPDKISATASFTLFKCEYKAHKHATYISSAWDNRFIMNLSCIGELPHKWSIGGKLSLIGGAPYTPYDADKSSLVDAWNAYGKAYYDYTLYNTKRLPTFAQLDIRIDKNYYFKNWRFGFYVGIENVTASKLKQQDALVSTGKIQNPEAQSSQQRYVMKHIKQQAGSIVPSIGITAEF